MSGISRWSTVLTEPEWQQVRDQYDRLLGPGELEELFRFVPFLHDVRPDALKRYRLFVDTVTQGIGLENPMPNPPVASLVSGHFYTTLPYPEGVAGDLFVARQFGGKRQEVADILTLAFLHSGPFGMNTSARAADPYLRSWDPADDGPGIRWPDGWSVDPGAFRCGIDFSRMDDTNEILPSDLERIVEWHRRVQGAVPQYVPFLAKHYPLALKTFRARYETSMEGTLPKQFIALCHVHLAACWNRPDALSRALHMAKHFDVEKDQVVQILTLSMLYLGDIATDAAIGGLDGVLAEWSNA
jgi:hypothetical protein